jgi:hypothetical protein
MTEQDPIALEGVSGGDGVQWRLLRELFRLCLLLEPLFIVSGEMVVLLRLLHEVHDALAEMEVSNVEDPALAEFFFLATCEAPVMDREGLG